MNQPIQQKLHIYQFYIPYHRQYQNSKYHAFNLYFITFIACDFNITTMASSKQNSTQSNRINIQELSSFTQKLALKPLDYTTLTLIKEPFNSKPRLQQTLPPKTSFKLDLQTPKGPNQVIEELREFLEKIDFWINIFPKKPNMVEPQFYSIHACNVIICLSYT